ncbi:MAG: hypothetical protein HYU66_22770 [Armatimonadetes bacterium]|nr:hypothetical protein [Armatimonadota bacterium]
MGGLSYTDFVKFARSGNAGTPEARKAELMRHWPLPGRVVAYLDCGEAVRDGAEDAPRLRLANGTPFVWGGSQDAAPPQYGSVDFAYDGLAYEAAGLDPAKRYVVGWSWWDYDGNGRTEAVRCGEAVLLQKTLLPTWKKSQPPEERAAVLPPGTYAGGSAKVVFTDEATVSNAVVSEIWLWELDPEPEGARRAPLPEALAHGAPVQTVAQPDRVDGPVGLDLYARDPVGHQVGSELYFPDDRFYLDAGTADPFEALEAYGRRLRAVMGAPNPYDFPTVCAWYVGLFAWPAGNQPERSKYKIATSAGLVEEMQKCRDSGFLSYSRAAMRLVPDTYVADSEQGWWDDEHWQKHLHYTAPYETTAEYCAGVREAGGLPFTYFQSDRQADDFRLEHPGWLLGHDPKRTLDYTHPGAVEHLQRVYANLRAGGMKGMMFDYPDGLWGQLTQGGFSDRKATAAFVYRWFLQLAKEGLGPDSWIHERILGDPLSDLTIGVADSQRVWGDTSAITPEMVSRCGLRWYKSRVVMAYDMDAKNLLNGWQRPGFEVADQDGRRMLLTMAYVAASRLLLATSFRDMPPEVLHDLERTSPYPKAPQSARPVDMLVADGWPRVYDYAVTPGWHQVTLFNHQEPAQERTIAVPFSGEPANGALGLDPSGEYHLCDFWNERYAGRVKGDGKLTQTLRPGEARMLSVHRVEPNPQFLSTNRHVMQGVLDLPRRPAWDGKSRTLSGSALVVGGEPFRIMLAPNGWRAVGGTAFQAVGDHGQDAHVTARIEPEADGLTTLVLTSPANAEVAWSVSFSK